MRETIHAALKAATKARDARRVSTLRLMSAAIKDRDIAARTAGKGEATDAELLELLAKMIKQREESQKIYAEAGRAELAAQEGEEVVIIREFLPKQLSDEDMAKAIDEACATWARSWPRSKPAMLARWISARRAAPSKRNSAEFAQSNGGRWTGIARKVRERAQARRTCTAHLP